MAPSRQMLQIVHRNFKIQNFNALLSLQWGYFGFVCMFFIAIKKTFSASVCCPTNFCQMSLCRFLQAFILTNLLIIMHFLVSFIIISFSLCFFSLTKMSLYTQIPDNQNRSPSQTTFNQKSHYNF